ncbi:MAG: hypothetical protein NTW08_03595 [Gammaproteobacteria bacterium]|nr:hypothetical protein [Gammaproteobacteria bacterium]
MAKQIKRIQCVILSCLSFCPVMAFASLSDLTTFFSDLVLKPNSAWVTSLTVGPIWESAGLQQTLMLAPDILKTYAPSLTTQALAKGDLFLGKQLPYDETWTGELGLAAGLTSRAGLGGDHLG